MALAPLQHLNPFNHRTLPNLITIGSSRSIVVVDPDDGGRIISMIIDGFEILRDEKFNAAKSIFGYGCFPMAPYAGRIRHGQFEFNNQNHQLELADPPHAIHGTVINQAWQVLKRSENQIELATPISNGWPYRGEVIQSFELLESKLILKMKLTAHEPMPAWIGFHPWFRKDINGSQLTLTTNFEQMYVRDCADITTNSISAPKPPPWDDCFIGADTDVQLNWDSLLTLKLRSNFPYWVIYSDPADAICVEPQTAPPNAIELELNQVLDSNESVELEFTISF
jgi:aldose 1-epimerase